MADEPKLSAEDMEIAKHFDSRVMDEANRLARYFKERAQILLPDGDAEKTRVAIMMAFGIYWAHWLLLNPDDAKFFTEFTRDAANELIKANATSN